MRFIITVSLWKVANDVPWISLDSTIDESDAFLSRRFTFVYLVMGESNKLVVLRVANYWSHTE